MPNWHSGGNHTALFAGHPVGGVLQPQAREALAARFFALDELPEALLWWHRHTSATLGSGCPVTR